VYTAEPGWRSAVMVFLGLIALIVFCAFATLLVWGLLDWAITPLPYSDPDPPPTSSN
jgi:hypothetical protein